MDTEMDNGTARAPEGCIYVCTACGKTSHTRTGMDARGRNIGMPGWDSSCYSNSALIREADIEERSESGRVLKVRKDARTW